MPKNTSGIIFKTDRGDFGIAYYCEQRPEFENIGKMLIHLYEDIDLKVRKGDKPVLKTQDKLTPIGFND